MLSVPMTSLPTRKRTRSSMALQVNSMGPVDIQVKTIHVERDRQSVVLELRYGRHETDLNRATSWYRTLWQDSNPCTRDPLHQDVSLDPKGHGRDAKATSMSLRRMTSNRAGGRCDNVILTPKQSPVSRPCTATEDMPSTICGEWSGTLDSWWFVGDETEGGFCCRC